MSLPLQGIRVVDLSRLVAGNMTTLQFADFGADVIKVEQPGKGDPLRAWKSGGADLWWREYGRNKRSLELDLSDSNGRTTLLRLLERADLLVENFIPGSLSKWSLSHDAFLARNPRLVILSISGWGQTGPYRSRPGFGTLVEAMSGLADMTGFPDGPPTMPPIPIADMIAGLYGAFAAMVALRYRDLSGRGQVVDLSLLEPIFSVLGPIAATHHLTGRIPERRGNRSPNNAPRNTYKTRDGRWIVISVSTPRMAEKFFHMMNLGHLLEDSRFSTHESRVINGDAIDAIVAETIERFDAETLIQMFEEAGVAGAPVLDVAQLLEDPHVVARGLVEDIEDPELGRYPMHSVIPRFSVTPGVIRHPGPPLGAHSQEVLSEIEGAAAEDRNPVPIKSAGATLS